jgi:hypothetical protein
MHDKDLDPDLDAALRDRLSHLEAAAPGALPPMLPAVTTRTHKLRGLGLALAAVVLIGGAATAGSVVFNNAIGRPGLFNAGQPLACTGVERMTPPEAAHWLSQHGYTVTWQIEARTGGSTKESSTSTQSATPPQTGYVIDGVLEGKHLTMVVETGPGATPRGPVGVVCK